MDVNVLLLSDIIQHMVMNDKLFSWYSCNLSVFLKEVLLNLSLEIFEVKQKSLLSSRKWLHCR